MSLETLSSILHPVALTCEYGLDPLGIDVPDPRLFWKLESDARGASQTAYHILAATSRALLDEDRGDLWDSGKIECWESLHIHYAGAPLKSSMKIFWKVRVWDQNNAVSDWSEMAAWTMGIMHPSDWQASWITAREALSMLNRPHAGFRSSTESKSDASKWVTVNLDHSQEISEVILRPAVCDGVEGYGFPVRFRVILANWNGLENPEKIADFTSEDFVNPGNTPVVIECGGVVARTIRIEAVRLWGDEAGHVFALSQVEIISRGDNAALDTSVSASDSAEDTNWSLRALIDGMETPKSRNYSSLRAGLDYNLSERPSRAIVHVCGLGYHEMTVNHRRVGNNLLAPGWTNYDKSRLYDTFEISDLLQPGMNRFEFLLGNGFFNVSGGRYTKFRRSFGPLSVLAHIRLEYADGRVEVIGTDDGWRVKPGPITFSCIYGGEDYDARLEDSASENVDCWEQPMLMGFPDREMRGFCGGACPIREIEVLPVRNLQALSSGVTVYDLGQNAPIIPRLKVSGPAGSSVKVTPAELLGPDGKVDRCSVGNGEAYWKYTLAGRTEENWFPKFFYHGCRYLQVETFPHEPGGTLPQVLSLEGVVVHSSSKPVGEFSCSNELFNRIRTLIRWAQRANLMHVITDCPHREKLGWLEEYYLNGPALRYEFDLSRLFTKGLQDMADAQLPNGLVPDIAPEYVVFSGGFRDSPEWGSAYVISAWQQYLWHGDLEQLRRHYTGMKRYVEYLDSRSRQGILRHGLGDWVDLGPESPGPAQLTPPALTATAVFYYDAMLLSKIAGLLGRESDAKRYHDLAEKIFQAFNLEFWNRDTGEYSTGSQCANSIALVMGFVPEADRAKVLQAIVNDVEARGNSLSAGDVGHRYLLRVLAENGRSEVIFAMNNQSEKPGYGLQLQMGATSLTETWDANRQLSQNHFMLGQLMEWFYQDLAGIGLDPEAPAFRNVIVRPQPVGDIKWVQASHDSLRGPISVNWERDDITFRLSLHLPANTSGTVYLPCPEGWEIREQANTIQDCEGIQVLRREQDGMVLQVVSGKYDFSATAPKNPLVDSN